MKKQQNIYLFHKMNKEMLQFSDSLHDLAKKYNIKEVSDSKNANLIVSIGGDGTFLQAVRKTNFRDDCLYAGISTEEKLHIYCDFSIYDQNKILAAITNERIAIRRYPLIEVSFDDQEPFYCLNELSIRSSIIKTFVLDVFIDDLHFETFRGDGMIISTPTGSTAYNKSTSGAVVDPFLPSFQVSELASLNNNSYRTLGSSFILSGKRTLTLKIAEHDSNVHPIIGLDNEALSISNLKKVQIKLSNKVIKTVKLKDNSFWEKVKRTFL